MAAIAGYNGSFRIAANAVGDITEFSLDIERGIEADTAFGDSWDTQVQTLKRWSGTAKGFWRVDSDTYQLALQTALLNGTDAAIRLYPDSDSYYSGNAVIGNISTGATVDGLVEVEFSFTGNGALTLT
jgi:predicted secreted protein